MEYPLPIGLVAIESSGMKRSVTSTPAPGTFPGPEKARLIKEET
jgi:hypothetical protein